MPSFVVPHPSAIGVVTVCHRAVFFLTAAFQGKEPIQRGADFILRASLTRVIGDNWRRSVLSTRYFIILLDT
jgi:hypothetical protein